MKSRCMPSIRTIKTLDDLCAALKEKFGREVLSRSGVYLRLLPRRADTREGQRHITTVLVKLVKPQEDGHQEHIDTCFATAAIRHLEELAAILGPKFTFFLSQDDKARVPIGIMAANKQSTLLMSVEYRVQLQDHTWPIAKGHKLIPSVYAGIVRRIRIETGCFVLWAYVRGNPIGLAFLVDSDVTCIRLDKNHQIARVRRSCTGFQ